MASLALLPKQVLCSPASRRSVLSRAGRAPQSLLAIAASFSTARGQQRTTKFATSNKNVLSKGYIQYFSTSPIPRAANAIQEAPNAQAYLNSGAIAGARDLVDVKKVLVIGSGGLAIGQAGEFDYSGTSLSCFFFALWHVLALLSPE
jgi:carbamoyl-phosphate synthase large subunit